MAVTAHVQTAVIEAMVARELCVGRDDTLAEERQSLGGLKGRALAGTDP